jgi:pyroglutamyl-peptidase
LPKTLPNHPDIELIIHSPLPVSYRRVARIVPALLERDQPDIILHIGLAGGRGYYAIERSSERGRYEIPDVDGQTLTEEENDAIFPPDQTPQRIETGLEYDKVCADWVDRCERDEGCGGVKVRESDDVGLYMCGFSYYTSLAWNLKKKGNGGSVLFLHVPRCPTEDNIEKGARVAVHLIESMVDAHLRHEA